MLLKIQKLIPDTPENEQIYFSASRKQGRFWIDDPFDPKLLLATTGGNAPICFLRKVKPGPLLDWENILREVRPAGALAGDADLVRNVFLPLGYGAPSIEIVHCQHGWIRLNEPLAEKIMCYEENMFYHVDRNAPWMWDAYQSPQKLLEDFPALAILENRQIIAIASVYSHSIKWASICYWVHTEHRGKGLATRCAAAMSAYLNQRGYSVCAATEETHFPSLAVMKKIGLKEYSRYALAPHKRGE